MLSFARQILNRHFLLNWKLSETYQITPTFSKCEMICWKCKGYNLKTLPSSDFWIYLDFRARYLCRKVFWVQWVKNLSLGKFNPLVYFYEISCLKSKYPIFYRRLLRNYLAISQENKNGFYSSIKVLNLLVSRRLLSPYLINFVYFGLS